MGKDLGQKSREPITFTKLKGVEHRKMGMRGDVLDCQQQPQGRGPDRGEKGAVDAAKNTSRVSKKATK